jgi:hypothetical protein
MSQNTTAESPVQASQPANWKNGDVLPFVLSELAAEKKKSKKNASDDNAEESIDMAERIGREDAGLHSMIKCQDL